MGTVPFPIFVFLLGFLLMFCCPAWGAESGKPIRLAYTSWSSSVAGAHVMQALLQERLNIPCELVQLEPEDMWRSVATGEADAMLSAWLPTTHAEYMEKYGEHLRDFGPNLEGARIGLVVPDVSVGRQTGSRGERARPYIHAESIPDLLKYADRFRHRIIGIDPQSGVMARAQEAIRAYDLERFRLIDSSEASMLAELSNAIRHQQWIVVTGWTPHWMFARWKLKFLEDPKGVFGGLEAIHTMVRQGLDTENPAAYALLDRFHWTPEQMSRYLVWNRMDHGLYPYEKAQRWLFTHPEQVSEWLKGMEQE